MNANPFAGHFTDLVAVVSGGASGIGLATAVDPSSPSMAACSDSASDRRRRERRAS